MTLTNLAEAFATRFQNLPTYRDGVLHRSGGYVDNGKGTMTKGEPIDAPIKVQIDDLTQSQREAGYAEDDVRLIVLLAGLSQYLDEPRLRDDDEIEIPELNVTYRVAGPSIDPLRTHASCRGRVKPNA